MTTSYPELILALADCPIIIQYDERDDILHTPEWPQCKDESCPCQEPQKPKQPRRRPRPLHTAPSYLNCSCQRCSYVKSVLAEHAAWDREAMQQEYDSQEDVEHLRTQDQERNTTQQASDGSWW
jgi:hypothetical protein